MKLRTVFASTLMLFAATACEDLPPGNVKDPHYWGNAFLKKYESELVVGQLEASPGKLAKPRVVLLITGVTIPAKWFEPIEARLTRDGFIPVVYEPPELLSGDLEQNTKWLGDVIEKVKADYKQDTIDILAECTGGVIARHYIQSLGGAKNVARMVTFISPQHGVGKAPMAAAVAGWPALYDLSPGSKFLTAVNQAPLPKDVAFTSIYSCTDEYIQPYQSSIIPGAKNIGLCNGFVGHFEFFYNPAIYKIMYDELVAPAPKDMPGSTGSGGSGSGNGGSGSGSGGAGGAAGFGNGGWGAVAGAAGSAGAAGDGFGESAGAAGAGAQPSTNEGPTNGAPADDFEPYDGGGCSTGGSAPEGGALWLALAALGMAWQRRRAIGSRD
ncbi:MAG: MYXO-CTERM sorting domain-containing protein [Polyangiaceae bacterium]